MASFRGDRFFLSNFYMRPIVWDGQTYASSEHAYASMKCREPQDQLVVRLTERPQDAKRLAAQARKAGRGRPDWDVIKIGVMLNILRAKFAQHTDLRDLLLATGSSPLVEENEWGDTFWGKCRDVAGMLQGQNVLGQLLEQVRDELPAPLRNIVVLVTGGRTFGEAVKEKADAQRTAERRFVHETLDKLHRLRVIRLLIHGACTTRGDLGRTRGADGHAEMWAQVNQVNYFGVPAKWNQLGTKAGMVRNAEMLALPISPDVGVAFPGNQGTAGMVSLCQRGGIPVWDLRAWPWPATSEG